MRVSTPVVLTVLHFVFPHYQSIHVIDSGTDMSWNEDSSAVAEMGDRLATIDMGRKVRGCCAPFWGYENVPI